MLTKMISTLNQLPMVKFNKIAADEIIAEATEMFNKGWEALSDGIAVQTKGNLVAVKSGNKIISYQAEDFRVESGKVIGKMDKILRETEVQESQKAAFTSQAIITRFYTIKEA